MTERITQSMNIFSTPMWVYDSLSHEENKNNIIETLENYQQDTHNRNRKHFKTFVTTRDLQHNPNFEFIIQDLKNIGHELITDWKLEESLSLGIGDMWATVSHKDGIIMPHINTHGFLYGMYFLNTPPDSGYLKLENPVYDKSFFDNFVSRELTEFNIPEFITPIPEGSYCIFPSHLSSQITNNNTDQDRIIIHFVLKVLEA